MKFKYGQKVKVINGFYKGQSGRIDDHSETIVYGKPYYYIKRDGFFDILFGS